MSGTCCFRVRWDLDEILALQKNTSFNMTEEFSSSPYYLRHDLLSCILILSFLILGIHLNNIIFMVFSQPTMRSAFSMGLLFIAGFDTVFLFCLLTKEIISMSVQFIAFFTVIQNSAWAGTVWSLFSLSVERFVAVFFPFKRKTAYYYRRVMFFYFFVLFFAIGFSIPLVFVLERISWEGDLMKTLLHLYYMYGPIGGLREMRFPLWFYRNKDLFEFYYFYINIGVMYCLPFFLTIFVRTLIFLVVRSAERTRRENGENPRIYQSSRSRVYSIIVVAFLLMHVASLILVITIHNGVFHNNVHDAQTAHCIVLSAYCSLKFFIYYCAWKDFRDAYRRTLFLCRAQNVVYDNSAVISTL